MLPDGLTIPTNAIKVTHPGCGPHVGYLSAEDAVEYRRVEVLDRTTPGKPSIGVVNDFADRPANCRQRVWPMMASAFIHR